MCENENENENKMFLCSLCSYKCLFNNFVINLLNFTFFDTVLTTLCLMYSLILLLIPPN